MYKVGQRWKIRGGLHILEIVGDTMLCFKNQQNPELFLWISSEEVARNGQLLSPPAPATKYKVGDKFKLKAHCGKLFSPSEVLTITEVLTSGAYKLTSAAGSRGYFVLKDSDLDAFCTKVEDGTEVSPVDRYKAELRGLLGIDPTASIEDTIRSLKRYKLCVENVRKETERATAEVGRENQSPA